MIGCGLMKQEIKGYIFALITILIWGSSFVVTKLLLDYISPTQILFTRFVLAIIFLMIIHPKFQLKWSFKSEKYFMISGVFLASYFIFENNALQNTYASNASLIIATIPLLTTIIAFVIFKEGSLKVVNIIGLIVSYIGVVLIVASGSESTSVNVLGDTLAFFAALSFSFYTIFLNKTSNLHIIIKTRRVFIYVTLIVAIYALLSSHKIIITNVNYDIIMGIIFLGIISSSLAFVLFNKAAKILGAVKVNNFTYLNPVITVIVSFIVLHEGITFFKVFGGIIVISGIVISEKNINQKVTK
jgi:drug/metabolite transporter (DMT)-like permease